VISLETERRPGLAVRALRLLGVLVFAVLIGATLLGAVARYFSVPDVEWSFELAGIAFVWVIFIGTIVAELEHQNVGFELLATYARGPWQTVLSALASFVLLGVSGALAWSAVLLVNRTMSIPTPVLRVSSAVSPVALAICSCALVVVAVGRLARLAR
jgi:TRAP-type transport system small permease protein